MSARKAVVEIRNLLIDKRHQCDGRENQSSTRDIIKEFQADNSDVIRRAHTELITMALTDIFHDGRRRGPKSVDPVQSSFLNTFGVNDSIYVPTEDGKLKPQHPMASTLPEILHYSEHLPDRRKKGENNKDKYRNMVATLLPHQTREGMTAGECWEAKLEAEREAEAIS